MRLLPESRYVSCNPTAFEIKKIYLISINLCLRTILILPFKTCNADTIGCLNLINNTERNIALQISVIMEILWHLRPIFTYHCWDDSLKTPVTKVKEEWGADFVSNFHDGSFANIRAGYFNNIPVCVVVLL